MSFSPAEDRQRLSALYATIRRFSETLCEPLEPEDLVVQSMPDVSPTKWHLAHTSWFFETFVLRDNLAGYQAFHPGYEYLFNSYYNAVGDPYPRDRRGLLSRPTVREVHAYRRHVDEAMDRFFATASAAKLAQLAQVIEVGLNHEEQHQELMLTDLKHVLYTNPLRPVYRSSSPTPTPAAPDTALTWTTYPGRVARIGFEGSTFAFDNETPAHEALTRPYSLANRLVTCAEYLAFIEDGGYDDPRLWLSDGWALVHREGWQAPLYWTLGSDGWEVATLAGARPLSPHEPVCHVSFYEADAYATWAGSRLPLESEWELASTGADPAAGNFVEDGHLHPRPLRAALPGRPAQLLGDVWEWTASPYTAYPGFRPFAGDLGEYNGKFMCNQLVLRGGSCATSRRHIRRSYRNFFPAGARWQFMGIRLAR